MVGKAFMLDLGILDRCGEGNRAFMQKAQYHEQRLEADKKMEYLGAQ